MCVGEKCDIECSEVFYRRVKNKGDSKEYTYENDKLVIFANAFNDGAKQPSLYRANKIENKPERARVNEKEGIVGIRASDINSIKIDAHAHAENICYNVKIKYQPSKVPKTGVAHSIIVVNPEFTGTKNEIKMAFMKLKEKLAIIATNNGWELVPVD